MSHTSRAHQKRTWAYTWIQRLTLLSCLLLSSEAVAAVKVVATLPSLASLAASVGQQYVEVESLAAATEDPHYVDARPNLVIKLNKAELLISNGLELEVGWLPSLVATARNPRISAGGAGLLEAASVVQRLEVPAGKIDRAQGDIHPGGNPHFLFDPRACAAVAGAIGEKLASIDAPHAATYRANASALQQSLLSLAAAQQQRFAALKAEQRRVTSYHRSLTYLNSWLGLQEVITVEPRPGIAPDPGHLSKVVSTMRSQGVKVILQEEFYPSNNSQTVANLVKGSVVILPGGASFSKGETCQAWLTRVADAVYQGLSR